jgi:hypothetical protein
VLTRDPGIEHIRRTPVALQGTIDAFPLTDVLQLLSSSAKSGRLLLEGDRGRAELWIDEGSVVGGEAGSVVTGAAQLVFELLRFDDGSFVFDALEGAPGQLVDATPLSTCVTEAVDMLAEWRRIEAVVPSMQHRVELRPELPSPSVTVGSDEWAVLAAAGDGPRVEIVGRRLGLDDFACCAALAALVERELLAVAEPIEPAERFVPELIDSTLDEQDLLVPVEEAAVADEAFPDRFPIDDLLGQEPVTEASWTDDDLAPRRFAAAQTFEPLGADAFTGDRLDADPDLSERTADAWDEVVSGQVPVADDAWHDAAPDSAAQQAVDDTADEVLRQMSRLSPQAAEAIAAALSGPPPAAAGGQDPSSERREDDGPVTFMGSF